MVIMATTPIAHTMEALCGISECSLPDYSVQGRTAQPPCEIASGGKPDGLRHHQPDGGSDGEASRGETRAVRRSERQADAGAERGDDECDGGRSEGPCNGGAP
jgi:hypothetical protein